MSDKTLLLTDLQNDFMPGGALAVAGGNQLVPLANRLMTAFSLIVATQDWHPAGHGSFAANHEGRHPGEQIELDGLHQVLWPVHCVMETPGAAFHRDLEVDRIDRIFRKGTDPRIDSYSGFYDNGHRKATGLGDYLRGKGVREIYICGLTTDYCVRFTALDAVREGFGVCLITDACRGVDLSPGDVDRAIAEMREAGVRMGTVGDIVGRVRTASA